MLSERNNVGAVVLKDNRVLVVGGDYDDKLTSTKVLHLASETFSPGPSIIESGHDDCAAAVLKDGQMVVIGGKIRNSL